MKSCPFLRSQSMDPNLTVPCLGQIPRNTTPFTENDLVFEQGVVRVLRKIRSSGLHGSYMSGKFAAGDPLYQLCQLCMSQGISSNIDRLVTEDWVSSRAKHSLSSNFANILRRCYRYLVIQASKGKYGILLEVDYSKPRLKQETSEHAGRYDNPLTAVLRAQEIPHIKLLIE